MDYFEEQKIIDAGEAYAQNMIDSITAAELVQSQDELTIKALSEAEKLYPNDYHARDLFYQGYNLITSWKIMNIALSE